MKRQTTLLFYFLSFYVLLQFVWWAFYLIELSSLTETAEGFQKRVLMVLGEGFVFIAILLFGILRLRKSILKDIRVSKQQNNFLLSVTHELKTPLTSNKLFLQTLLKRENLERDQAEKIIKQAIHENNRLSDMIDNILTATRIDGDGFQMNFEEINLSEEITALVDKWSAYRVPVNLTIEQNVNASVDIIVLKTILYNLLENSYKYAGENPEIEVYLNRENNSIVLGVKDKGKGIPNKYKSEVFKKFVRIGNEEIRNQKGTGLGLYIVEKMVTYHGGEIICLDNKPQGADFKITLYERR